MSRITKTIENPEVPGLESFFPPPLPLQSKATHSPREEEKIIPTSTPAILDKSGDESVFSQPAQNPFFAPSDVKQIAAVAQPWWIPTESDTADVPQNSSWMGTCTPWMDSNQKNVPPCGNAKSKLPKRKSESIDPAQDAERTAIAQKHLSELMKPLRCDLCNAIMNSTVQAKLHYEGKPHQKKVSMFLNQSVKKLKPEEVTSTSNKTDWNTYCDVCKTWFTSLIDASQHYAGKKHIRATTGATKPKTKKPTPATLPIDSTGRFGIGMAFSSNGVIENPVDVLTMAPVASIVDSPVRNHPTLQWPFPTFRCELCSVTTNRPEQLKAHERGARHLRMLKLNNFGNPHVDEVEESITQSTSTSIDYSIYRTPSEVKDSIPFRFTVEVSCSSNDFSQMKHTFEAIVSCPQTYDARVGVFCLSTEKCTKTCNHKYIYIETALPFSLHTK
ncbi:uncharacterized protein [Venturia canescens]|uniref:uncharacterized protein isoform X2 n=1 Tax=Venturia canescens TaxID=32260 RepID=UPI001C9D44B5|nr:uncharacterized protein LOC122413116 isoform X2 [Venturia canescens]